LPTRWVRTADIPDAYERLIMDVIRGNQTLFMRGDEVEAAWAWTDPVIAGWEARGGLLVNAAAAARLVPLVEADIVPLLPIDVLLLGMGADGHVASLFPGADVLAAALAADAPAVIRLNAPGAPEPRVSLTSPVLASAKRAHLVITGAEKRAVLERARQQGDPGELPVRAVLPAVVIHYAP
jgi:6-phosphogluconolactonase